MSKKITCKRANSAKNVSHANNRTNKKQNLNFQKFNINGVKFVTTVKEAKAIRKFYEN
jgi:ribosomal protein L28